MTGDDAKRAFVYAARNNGMPVEDIERCMGMVERGGYIIVGDGATQVSFYNLDGMPWNMLTFEERVLDACCKAVVYDRTIREQQVPIAVYYWGSSK